MTKPLIYFSKKLNFLLSMFSFSNYEAFMFLLDHEIHYETRYKVEKLKKVQIWILWGLVVLSHNAYSVFLTFLSILKLFMNFWIDFRSKFCVIITLLYWYYKAECYQKRWNDCIFLAAFCLFEQIAKFFLQKTTIFFYQFAACLNSFL